MKTIILKEGERFGRLTIIREVEPKKYGKRGNIRQFLCKCDCGNETIVGMNNLRNGVTRSCGCLRRELNRGFIEDCLDKPLQSRLHNIWLAMRNRCNNKKGKDYRNYTLKGITVCDEWKDFNVFFNWAINNGYAPNLSLDRIDNDKGYSPQNCRWATQKEQMNNVRYNRILTLNGVSHTLSEWGEITGIDWTTIQSRKRNGWSDKEALTTPIGKAKDYDVRVGKDELAAIFNNSIASGLCVSKIDFVRKAGISKSVFFSTLYGDGRMSKKTSEKVRKFYESNLQRNIETI